MQKTMRFEGNLKFSTSFLGLYFWFVLPVLLIKITEAFNSEAYHVMLYEERTRNSHYLTSVCCI